MKKKVLMARNALVKLTMSVFILGSVSILPAWGASIPVTDANLNSTKTPDHITLTWSNDPKTTQTITWRTSTNVKSGVVQVLKLDTKQKNITTQKALNDLFNKNKKLIRQVKALASKFDTTYPVTDPSKGTENIFTSTVTGLTPGSMYIYRVGDGTSGWSNINTFKTEAAKTDAFKFLVFGDSQDSTATYKTWHTTVTNAYNANKDAKFMANVGDLTDNAQMYSQWNGWFDASKGVIDNIPEMAVTGNHDYKRQSGTINGISYGSYCSDAPYFKSQLKLYNNGPTAPYNLKGTVYSYDYGNVHFVVLDSQWRERFVADSSMDQATKLNNMKAMMNEELSWADSDLKKTDKQWKVVMFHKPPYYNDQLRTNADMKNFQPIFDKYHVDVVFNGHDHAQSRTVPVKYDAKNKINVFAQSPADATKYQYKGKTYKYNGTVYITAGRSSNNCKPDVGLKVWNAFIYDTHRLPVYNTVEVNQGKLTVKCFEQDGNLIDNYVIDKDHPENSTPAYASMPNGAYNSSADPSSELPRMILYGQPINFGYAPKKANNTWYIDFNILYDYTRSDFNGKTDKFDSTTNKWQFDDFSFDNDLIKNKVAQLNDSMFLDSTKSMISIDALKRLGFSCEYHPETNTIMIEMSIPD